MVFEDLITPLKAKKYPQKLFFIGLGFSILSVLFSLWVFKNEASLVMVFLTVVMVMPLMYFTLKDEEEEDMSYRTELWILKEHMKAVKFLIYLFLGFVVGFSLFYLVLPDDTVAQLFNSQIKTIENINSNVVSGSAVSLDTFFSIIGNNIRVLIFCLIFAFFFGAGAIFILAWNASVISAAVGTYFRNALSDYAQYVGLTKAAIYLNLFVAGIMRYMIHGVFEIGAYFIGAIAGGIISMALVNSNYRMLKYKRIVTDVSILIVIALGLLFIGAVIEVYLTPLIF